MRDGKSGGEVGRRVEVELRWVSLGEAREELKIGWVDGMGTKWMWLEDGGVGKPGQKRKRRGPGGRGREEEGRAEGRGQREEEAERQREDLGLGLGLGFSDWTALDGGTCSACALFCSGQAGWAT